MTLSGGGNLSRNLEADHDSLDLQSGLSSRRINDSRPPFFFAGNWRGIEMMRCLSNRVACGRIDRNQDLFSLKGQSFPGHQMSTKEGTVLVSRATDILDPRPLCTTIASFSSSTDYFRSCTGNRHVGAGRQSRCHKLTSDLARALPAQPRTCALRKRLPTLSSNACSGLRVSANQTPATI